MLFSEYKELPKWKGKIFMQDEETCYNDGWQNGYTTGLSEGDEQQKIITKLSDKNLILRERNNQLEKENVELKKQQFSLRNERNTFLAQNEQYEKDLIDFNENFIKTKEIIKNLIETYYHQSYNKFDNVLKQAEQFLKSIEV